MGRPGDDLHIAVEYEHDTSSWILGLPTSIDVREKSASGPILRRRGGAYDQHGNLTKLQTDTGTGTATMEFGYDRFGNLAQVTTPPNHAGDAWSFAYDGVDRLTSATGKVSLQPGKRTRYSQDFAYSPSHNLLAKDREHVVTQPGDTPVKPPHTNIELGYDYGERPHLPARVGDLALRYDPSGNVTRRQRLDTGRTEHLVWDDDGRLVEIQRAGTHQRNYYGADGRRVLRRGRHGETIFASEYFDLRNGELATKHVFAGPVRVASILSRAELDQSGPDHTPPGKGGTPPGKDGDPPGQVKEAPPGPGNPPDRPGRAFYFDTDHLGSTTVLTDDDGEVHEHLQYFPDGAIWIERGPRRPVNGYRFSGKPIDPETGFYDFGERFYDPDTSLWLGIDPAFTDDPAVAVGAPPFLSPLAYAAHNPIALIDPDGRQAIAHDYYERYCGEGAGGPCPDASLKDVATGGLIASAELAGGVLVGVVTGLLGGNAANAPTLDDEAVPRKPVYQEAAETTATAAGGRVF